LSTGTAEGAGMGKSERLETIEAHAHTALSEWIPAGAGIVRCRGCETTYSLVTGKEVGSVEGVE
jgi:hypothetical protein